jgi:hypothetical protein
MFGLFLAINIAFRAISRRAGHNDRPFFQIIWRVTTLLAKANIGRG